MTDAAELDLRDLRARSTAATVGISRRGRREVHATGSARPGSAFRIASLTKPFTALAALRAIRQSDIDLGTPVAELLDRRRAWPADPGITLGQLLAQTSGLAPADTGAEIAALGDGEDALAAAAGVVLRAGSHRTPGRRWEYYNGNYILAGAVVAALQGTGFETALNTLVLAPAGLSATTFAVTEELVGGSEAGQPMPGPPFPRGRRPSGGLISTAEDVLRFADHLLADEEALASTRRRWTDQDDPIPYGLGWAIGPSGQLYANGRLPGYRAAIVLLPESGFAAVGLASGTASLPALAAFLSQAQFDLTGDDLAGLIEAFAA